MFYHTWQRTWRFFGAAPMFAENSPVPSDFFVRRLSLKGAL